MGWMFVAPWRVRLRDRMAGLDDDWVDAGTTRIARFARLPAGSYRFQLQACNADGVWARTTAELAFVIAPHFWETGWFAGALFAAAVALGGAITRYVSV